MTLFFALQCHSPGLGKPCYCTYYVCSSSSCCHSIQVSGRVSLRMERGRHTGIIEALSDRSASKQCEQRRGKKSNVKNLSCLASWKKKGDQLSLCFTKCIFHNVDSPTRTTVCNDGGRFHLSLVNEGTGAPYLWSFESISCAG